MQILELYHSGRLGGEVMPEDSNPGLGIGSMFRQTKNASHICQVRRF